LCTTETDLDMSFYLSSIYNQAHKNRRKNQLYYGIFDHIYEYHFDIRSHLQENTIQRFLKDQVNNQLIITIISNVVLLYKL
jgi:hypothetical protein